MLFGSNYAKNYASTIRHSLGRGGGWQNAKEKRSLYIESPDLKSRHMFSSLKYTTKFFQKEVNFTKLIIDTCFDAVHIFSYKLQ